MKHLKPRRKPRLLLVAATALVAASAVAALGLLLASPGPITPEQNAELTESLRDDTATVPSAMPEAAQEILAADADPADASASQDSNDAANDVPVSESYPGEVVTTVTEGAKAPEVGDVIAGATITEVENIGDGDAHAIYKLTIDDASKTEAAIGELDSTEGVEAQPNFIYRMLDVPEAEEASAGDATGTLDAAATDIEAQSSRRTNDAGASRQYSYLPAPQNYNDPYYRNESKEMGASVYDAWNLFRSNRRVTVAVLDTGVFPEHPDLQDNLDKEHMLDTFADRPTPGQIWDNVGHGTHVCGIVAATADNALGMAGASYNANVLPIKVFDNNAGANAGASTTDIVEAYQYLDYLIGHRLYNGEKVSTEKQLDDLRVINMSLGYYDTKGGDQVLREQIEHMRDKHRVLTVAAGGNGDSRGNPYTITSYPSDYDAVLSVTSMDRYGDDSKWSDYNQYKDISAPGEDIYSTYPGGGYTNLSGTSMASPLVAGISGLLYSADPTLTPAEVIDILQSTAHYTRATDRSRIRKDFVYNEATHTYEPGPNATGSPGMVDAELALYKVLTERLNYTQFIEPDDVSLERTVYDYTSYEIEPKVTVTHGGRELQLGQDYKVTYLQNLRPGTATVMVEGINGWHGYIGKDFTINITEEARIPIDQAKISGLADRTFTYSNHNPIEPTITLTHTGNDLFRNETLKLGEDYTVEYANNIEVGTAQVTIEGIGIFKGKRVETFEIVPATCDLIVDESRGVFRTRVGDGEQVMKIFGPSRMEYKVSASQEGIVDAECRSEWQNLAQFYYNTIVVTPLKKGDVTLTLTGSSKNYVSPEPVEIIVHVAGEGEGLYDGTRSIEDAVVKIGSVEPYAGGYVTPSTKVMLNGEILNPDTDYLLEWIGNNDAGEASVLAKGRYSLNGEHSTGFTGSTRQFHFTIPKGTAHLTLDKTTYSFGTSTDPLEVRPTSITSGLVLAKAESSSPSVATAELSSDQSYVIVKPVGSGQATITVSTWDNGNYKTATAKLGVSVGSGYAPQVPTQDPVQKEPAWSPALPTEPAKVENLPESETFLLGSESRAYQLKVTGGGLERQVSNTNDAVASAELEGTKLTITPGSKGTTTITVNCIGDNEHYDTTASMVVTVRDVKEDAGIDGLPANETLTVGETMTYSLTTDGGELDPAVVNENAQVADARLSGKFLTITPKAPGRTRITVSCHGDSSHYDATSTLNLTVKAKTDATISGLPSGNKVALDAGASKNYDLTVNGGTLRSDLGNSNSSAATAKLSGNRLTITAQDVKSQAQTRITLHCDGDATHNGVDAVLTVTVNPKTGAGGGAGSGSGSGSGTTPSTPSPGTGGNPSGGATPAPGPAPAPGGDGTQQPGTPELLPGLKPVDDLAEKAADELNKADGSLTVETGTTADDEVTWTVTLGEAAQESPAAEVGNQVVGSFIRTLTSGDGYKTVRSISTVTGSDPRDEVTIQVKRGMAVTDEQIAKFAEKLGITTAELHRIGTLATGADATGEDLVDKSCQILVTNTSGKSITYTLAFKAAPESTKPAPAGTVKVYRLYNPHSGEHLFTRDENEYRTTLRAGWDDEGVAWSAPASSATPVFRLYNENSLEHLYAATANERDTLVRAGWTYEGVAWYSDEARGSGVYRLFNPHAPELASHHYTTDRVEYDSLVKGGWNGEGVMWYGTK